MYFILNNLLKDLIYFLFKLISKIILNFCFIIIDITVLINIRLLLVLFTFSKLF